MLAAELHADGFIFYALAFKTHRVFDVSDLPVGDKLRALANNIAEATIRHQRIDDTTSNGFGGALKCFERDRLADLRFLDGNDARLRNAHPLCELGRRHAESIADCANPPFARPRHVFERPKGRETLV